MQECVICKAEIKTGAKKCTSCNSFQGPLRRLLAGVDIRSLVALVPIITLAFLFIKDQVVTHKSDLQISILECRQDMVKIVASNLGDRAALLKPKANLFVLLDGKESGDLKSLVRSPTNETPPLVKPDQTIVASYNPILNKRTYTLPKYPQGVSNCQYKIIFDVIAFDHKPSSVEKTCVCPGKS
ncbi:hypothetical protein MNBD_DELTA01-216 [hydrothermal vent metagenome]|uniref:Uncharacterized protein n=1 Tax=hydrothermal vent metagenome TaxID=652676 RepID=A0A3B0QXU8_9ZZZZ